MTSPGVPKIQFEVSDDKESAQSRYDRGIAVGNQAPQSALYQSKPEVKNAADDVVVKTAALKTAMDGVTTAEAGLKKARTILGTAVAAFDGSYDVLVAVGEKVCTTPDQGTALGMAPRGKTKNPFVAPIGVDLKYDANKDELRIHVQRAPGVRAVAVQWSTNPSDPASWTELEGHGAVHLMQHPPKGTLFVRAASRNARAKSDFTSPVSVIVK